VDLERVAAVIRPRTYPEAVDLGFRMVRVWWKPIYGASLAVALPLFGLTAATLYRWPMIAILLIWWVKPVFDRVAVFVLSRALFGEVPTAAQALRAWPGLLRRDLPAELLWFRFDPIRSFRMPVWQLEGQRGAERRRRMTVMARGVRQEAAQLTTTCVVFEMSLFFGLLVLLLSFFPVPGWLAAFEESAAVDLPLGLQWAFVSLYALSVAAIEPFYVAGGFGLYINRRTHLEAWDIEVVLRRMATRLSAAGRRLAGAVTLALVASLALVSASPIAVAATPEPRATIDEVLADPIFGTERTETVWQLVEDADDRPEAGNLGFSIFGAAVAQVFRVLIWVLAVAGVVWLIVQLLLRTKLPRPRVSGTDEPEPPTELLGMDVREESLPDDVAAAARQLWDSGNRREALRLLYRGALSRLISRDRLPLKPSATEGDCLRLATRRVPASRFGYFRSLTETWQTTAYGHREPDDDLGLALIHEWNAHFGGAA